MILARSCLVVGSLVLLACRSATPMVSQALSSASASSASVAQPQLQFKDVRFDFGEVSQGTQLAHSFSFTNTGDAALVVRGIEKVVGCDARDVPKTLPPGVSGVLEIACPSDIAGRFDTHLRVLSNDKNAYNLELELVASVHPLLALQPALLQANLAFGETNEQDFALLGTRARDAKLTVKDTGDPVIEAKVIEDRGGDIAHIHVTTHGTHVGMITKNIVLATHLDSPTELLLPYSVRVTGTLEINPTNPYINMRISGPKATTIAVHSSQPGFAVHAVRVLNGPFIASFERTDAGEDFAVRVVLDESKVDVEQRGVVGEIAIVSNDRTEPERKVPLMAFGAQNRVPRPTSEGPPTSTP